MISFLSIRVAFVMALSSELEQAPGVKHVYRKVLLEYDRPLALRAALAIGGKSASGIEEATERSFDAAVARTACRGLNAR